MEGEAMSKRFRRFLRVWRMMILGNVWPRYLGTRK
jgi:hypothetical protein